LVGAALFVLAGIGGSTQIQKGLGVTDVVPSDSYVAAFFAQQSRYFANLGAPVYMVTKNLDYSDWAVQDQYTLLYQNATVDRYLTQPFVSWYDKMMNFWLPGAHSNETIEGRIPPDKFYPWLAEFLQDPSIGQFFSFDIVFDSPTSIRCARFLSYSVGLNTTSDYINAIQKTINDADESGLPGTFPYSVFYIYFEQYLLIDNVTIRGLLIAVAVVFVSSSLYLLHFGAALIVVGVVMMIEIDYISIMYYWGIDLNAISAVNLIMGLGIAVEFNTYIVQCFMESPKETRQERVEEAMMKVGVSVINGAVSTILGVLMLAFATYNIFRTYYFKMYFSIVIFGAAYGLIVLPVILSLVGPKYTNKDLLKHSKKTTPMEMEQLHEQEEPAEDIE